MFHQTVIKPVIVITQSRPVYSTMASSAILEREEGSAFSTRKLDSVLNVFQARAQVRV